MIFVGQSDFRIWVISSGKRTQVWTPPSVTYLSVHNLMMHCRIVALFTCWKQDLFDKAQIYISSFLSILVLVSLKVSLEYIQVLLILNFPYGFQYFFPVTNVCCISNLCKFTSNYFKFFLNSIPPTTIWMINLNPSSQTKRMIWHNVVILPWFLKCFSVYN